MIDLEGNVKVGNKRLSAVDDRVREFTCWALCRKDMKCNFYHSLSLAVLSN